MKLILGLGNPGTKYEHSRHNVGFAVIEQSAAFFQVRLKKRCFRLYRHARLAVGTSSSLLVQPLTYMNNSGDIAKYFRKQACSDMIVVLDQMDLPLGMIRIREGGSSAGHNGLKSLIEKFGCSDFVRIYVGIGRPNPGVSVIDHVLSQEDDPLFAEGVKLASEALCALVEGTSIKEVIHAYNRRVGPL
ncbi:MAG TPA: aminoacyl-tRNA hydrolase [Sphaerochaeta sp.]|nr:aminoacyl-tRNA hydrolase [Sphaerochaeta sp.]